MSQEMRYDAVVIGTGQGGKPLAAALAGAGHHTAVVERGDVGGTCVNVGCTPTKTMVASARAAHLANRSPEYGVEVGPVGVDLQTVRRRKRDIVDQFRTGSERSLEATQGLDLIRGGASFSGPGTLEVKLREGGTSALRADRIFINTGARPAVPPVEGLEEVPYLDSTSIMELGEPPGHLLVLGGGYVALEFAQMFRRFGSEVTIIQRGDQLLKREDPDVAGAVADILRDEGVEVLLEADATRAAKAGEGISLAVDTPGGEHELSGSHLLVATGRAPNTDSLNLDAAGIEVSKGGFVKVNEQLETSTPGVWALGDVNGGPAFTHIAYDDSRLLESNLLHGGEASTSDRIVSYTVYTDPQLGKVGLSEQEARERGLDFRVARMPMSRVARAMEMDETRGMMKAVVESDTDRILGGAVLGVEGGELMSMLQIAMMGDLPFTALRDAPLSHPTLAESFNNLFTRLD
ncbi:MAG: mercuric reductase [Rubrobacter sp.]|nr:mercuric reductase [Rubrobacter sp.]